MVIDVAAALSKLEVDVTGQEKRMFRSPNDLFRSYMDYIPLLPTAADKWSFQLYLPFQALSLDLQHYVTVIGYQGPTVETLTRITIQQQVLVVLRKAAVTGRRPSVCSITKMLILE